METEYDSTEGEQSVTVSYEGDDYTATREVGSGENYSFDSPTEVPLSVRNEVGEMNPEGVGTTAGQPSDPAAREAAEEQSEAEAAEDGENADNGGEN